MDHLVPGRLYSFSFFLKLDVNDFAGTGTGTGTFFWWSLGGLSLDGSTTGTGWCGAATGLMCVPVVGIVCYGFIFDYAVG